MKFYLGIHHPAWLWRQEYAAVPLFVSHNALKGRRSAFPRAVAPYGVDSGAYTHLTKHGRWVESPEEYVTALRRYWDELGPFDFAGQQDSICSPGVLAAVGRMTGRTPTVREQQDATVTNYLTLIRLAPDLPIAPTIQGDTYDEYMECVDLFTAAGVDLTVLPVVGVGSLVGRPPEQIERIATGLHGRGLARLHGFGVKGRGVDAAAHVMSSADSASWSYAGRRNPIPDCSHTAQSCAHCPRFALRWRAATLARIATGEPQLAFAF